MVLEFVEARVELVVPQPPRVSTKPIAHIRSILDDIGFMIFHS